ncbi:MAG: hypothetical protein A2171_00605 [Candidatus Levybacteria bacterium RBG_13_35_9]|nr:MAG: hypothetical protein A2171_00605 [Candidatus Levybacteria bacterium RBG_13_35_9]
MKKIFLIIVIMLLFTAGVSNAQTRTDNLRTGSASAQAQTIKAQNEQKLMENLKERANKEIDRRIAALNKLLTRLGQMKKLSAEQISSLQAQIQTDINGLNTLKAKINADTDLTTLRTDVKSIVTDYRIFAFFMKYINLSAALERASNLYDKLLVVHGKLAAKITEAASNGKDVTQLNTKLSDMKAKLDSAKTLIDAAIAEISGLNAQGYPGNTATLADARTKLKTAHQNLKDAHILSKKIINDLRSLNKSSSFPTVTGAPTSTPTATLTPTP